ncbi:septation protein SepH [Brachybacterium sp. FME24]|uniref:septation protein SepH n=1 Tax=Brachybacterium sp. FME24 TaxID=2742605 RepID=UPI0018690C44|nr:septation protein SepH [Brachybacterium sp. FME24]
MRELELDGIHDDGEHVILVNSDGERYALRIDKALRAAVRTDRPALGMIQAADATPLRPREIQAMLRSGRSAEDISEAADITLDRVRRYEGPVLAEREWTAQRARTFPVGRGAPDLDTVVAERLAAREATDETAWDAWRRADGTWTLELTFSAAGRTRQAHWVAELDNRSVTPIDDEARWISDEDAPPEPTRGRGRLQAVKSSVYDLEADGSFEEKTSGPRRGPAQWTSHPPVSEDHPAALDDSELDALNARRGLRSVPPPVDDSATVWTSLEDDAPDADLPGDIVPEVGTPGALAPSAPEEHDASFEDLDDSDRLDATTDRLEDPDHEALLEHSTRDDTDLDEASTDSTDSDSTDSDSADSESEAGPSEEDTESPDDGPTGRTDPATSDPEIRHQETVDLTPLPGFDDTSASGASDASGTPDPKPSRPAKSKSKRASMPSWDEIVFGSKHD